MSTPARHAGGRVAPHVWFGEGERRLRADLADHLRHAVPLRLEEPRPVAELPVRALVAGLTERRWVGMDPWRQVVLAESLGELLREGLGSAVAAHDAAVHALSGAGDRVSAGDDPPARALLAHAGPCDGDVVASTEQGGYRLDGCRRQVPSVPWADAFVVRAALAAPAASAASAAEVALLVPAAAPGLRAAAVDRVGRAKLWFDGVRLPPTAALPAAGDPAREAVRDRVLQAARLVAAADRALELTLEHLRGRRTFGVQVPRHQAVRFGLADLRAWIDGVRPLVYAAADRWACGHPPASLPDAALLRASETARRVTRRCLHLCGATGQLAGHPVNRAFLDARAVAPEAERRARAGLVDLLAGAGDG